MNIPNIMTVMRFLIIPFLGYYLLKEQYYVAGMLFLVGGITDVLDGFIARKFNMITSFGKLADPAADKLMQITALSVLTLQEKIPIVIVIVVVAKELFMSLGSIILYKKNIVVSANWYGKMSTVIFFIAIVLFIFRMPYSDVVIFIGVLATLFAFLMYSIDFNKMKNNVKSSRQ